MSARFSRGRLFQVAGIAVVGVLVLELLRTHVAQRYRIPSRSMEPTLHGDPERGDIVLVDKTGWFRSHSVSALARFDMVVVRDRKSADPLVKRIGSLGDEFIRIEDGDLFSRPLTGGPWQRVTKDPAAHRDLRFTFYEYASTAAGGDSADPDRGPSRYLNLGPAADGTIHLLPVDVMPEPVLRAVVDRRRSDGNDTRVLRTIRPIDVSFIDAAGRRSATTERRCDDIGVEADLELGEGCRGLCVAVVLRGRVFAILYERDGTLSWHGTSGSGPERGPELEGRASVVFGYLDGRLFLEVDGALVGVVPQALPASPDAEADNGVRLGLAARGEALARVRRLRLFHDVYYHAENQPWVGLKEYRIEPNEVFLLGDNTFDSVDSRTRGPFLAADIVGRPVAVIGPRRRVHWLPR